MEIVFIYLTEVIYKLWAICVTSANNHHKHLLMDCPDGSFGTSLREPRASCQIKISSNWFPAESWNQRHTSHLSLQMHNYRFSYCALQKKILMNDWWFHSKLKRTMNCYILSSKATACCVPSCFNTSVCILIEGDNILRVWPLETEYFKLGIISHRLLYVLHLHMHPRLPI